jgi:hypothetical protein
VPEPVHVPVSDAFEPDSLVTQEVPEPENSPPDPEVPDEQLEEGQCQFCFLKPCIAESCVNAQWIGVGRAPNDQNTSKRKDIYSRFWKCINNRRGWNHPLYLRKKEVAGGGPWVVTCVREVMPECVLKLARSKYPNPANRPYMGHKWW